MVSFLGSKMDIFERLFLGPFSGLWMGLEGRRRALSGKLVT